MNAKKHVVGAPNVDPCSSALWFSGWKVPPAQAPSDERGDSVTQAPRTWLLATGWKRHGLVVQNEHPHALP
jgi:hypothetical protein